MTPHHLLSAEAFGAQIEAAIRSGSPDAQQQCEAIAREAQRNPNILDGFADQADQLEYHLFRSDHCAIKIFNFDETLLTESPVHDHAAMAGSEAKIGNRYETRRQSTDLAGCSSCQLVDCTGDDRIYDL